MATHHMINLPAAYADLAKEPGPRLLVEFLKIYGTHEKVGAGSNPAILNWADATGLRRAGYNDDAIAWCGLAMAYAALQAGWDVPFGALGARNWLRFGHDALSREVHPIGPCLGDVLVFWRGSRDGWAGHVGIYVGEDNAAYHVLGGNQSDAVSFTRIDKLRLLGARRCPWRISQPANVRRIYRQASGGLSTNEA
jgi:uncharacterized protein (TIGR02594 family)